MDASKKPFGPRRFREVALASGLLTVAQLNEAGAELARERNPSLVKPEVLDKSLAEICVQKRWITPFQAREMLADRHLFRLGQYTILDEIGKGGMGQVFRAEHAMMGREVAVKVLPRAKATPESEAAFRREMRMLGRLDHENLVRAFDAGYDAMVYYLVTELVPGMDLKHYVQKYGPLNEATAASVIAQAARGLAYAHEQGLVHRDVKPGNLLVMQDGRVKVLDLGLAGSQLEEESLRIGRVIGTMDYIAPEQIRAPDGVGPSADIYSLGCTLYYAVTGRSPFPGGDRQEKMQKHLADTPDSVRRLAPHVSDAFCRVIEDMMAKTPEKRIASADAVVERLRPWLPEGQSRIDRGASIVDFGTGLGRESPRPPPVPPLQEEFDRSSASSSFGMSEVLADMPVELRESFVAWLGFFRQPWIVRLARQSVLVALLGGLGFGLAMWMVRKIDEHRFDSIFDGMNPAVIGLAVFFVLLTFHLAVGIVGRGRER